jgi:hypothetical protein
MNFTPKNLLAVAVLLLAVPAGAQDPGAQAPCRPTTTSPCPAAPTPYSTAQFSATFNGPVETWSEPNVQKTSMDIFYASKANRIEQTVAYRTINGEIAVDVDTASLDFYVKALTKKGETLKSRQDGTHHGHIFSYFEVETANEPPRLRRAWLLIQNSHTVFVVMQSAIEGVDDSEEWNALSKSFAIKE